ncbi:uncharacterized protein CLUP02_16755 [Colletotrichum lupini]|uniref:Uncharacterized protein n=1 Tax=Colletotrichum lupini TaxID=145971 RepID=A0A9Q8WPZ1_9PEZI|nr:uncharacterized protein CLUP02_16755 [Colletotrichum lupini]UQC91221.1 hypothetical protein CLUP02_16755 [Colletotrichum lupini]
MESGAVLNIPFYRIALACYSNNQIQERKTRQTGNETQTYKHHYQRAKNPASDYYKIPTTYPTSHPKGRRESPTQRNEDTGKAPTMDHHPAASMETFSRQRESGTSSLPEGGQVMEEQHLDFTGSRSTATGPAKCPSRTDSQGMGKDAPRGYRPREFRGVTSMPTNIGGIGAISKLCQYGVEDWRAMSPRLDYRADTNGSSLIQHLLPQTPEIGECVLSVTADHILEPGDRTEHVERGLQGKGLLDFALAGSSKGSMSSDATGWLLLPKFVMQPRRMMEGSADGNFPLELRRTRCLDLIGQWLQLHAGLSVHTTPTKHGYGTHHLIALGWVKIAVKVSLSGWNGVESASSHLHQNVVNQAHYPDTEKYGNY